MAINEIGYADKSNINTSSVPAQNKITDDDMNEVKTVVNANANLMGDLTGLTTTDKTSLVNAVNEVKSNLEWTIVSSVVGTGTISLPATFNELYCVVYGNGQPLGTMSIIIPYSVLSSTQYGFNIGYNNGTAVWGARILATQTQANLSFCWYGSTNYTNTSELAIYYR